MGTRARKSSKAQKRNRKNRGEVENRRIRRRVSSLTTTQPTQTARTKSTTSSQKQFRSIFRHSLVSQLPTYQTWDLFILCESNRCDETGFISELNRTLSKNRDDMRNVVDTENKIKSMQFRVLINSQIPSQSPIIDYS